MSYVSVWKPVNDEIVQASRNAKNEIIGLLIGRLESDTIVIENSVTGEFEAQRHRASLPTETLAKIADSIVSGRIKGSIVGWYHSHIEGGLFLSDTDIQTQKNLQQFSTLVTAMVVDAATGNVGYFRVDPQTGRQTRIPEENITVFEEQSQAVPAERKPTVRATPAIEVRPRPRTATTQRKQPTRKLVLAIIFIILASSIIVLALLFTRIQMPLPAGFAIVHEPIRSAYVGTPIEVKANVTGNIRNVTLHYAPVNSDTFTEAEMAPTTSGEFAYTINQDKVTGNIKYYIEAVDSLGNKQRTPTYTIPVADFSISAIKTTLTVYRNSSASIPIALHYVNGFTESVTFSASGAPGGVTLAFSPNPATQGITEITMNIIASPSVPNGAFSTIIRGTYSGSPQGSQVERETIIQVLITDFDLQVTPISRTIAVGASTSYTVTVSIAQGFSDSVQVTLQGLPQGATYNLATSGTTVAVVGGTGTTTLTLRIVTTSSIRPGTYALTVTAAGGGLVHSLTVQLIVR